MKTIYRVVVGLAISVLLAGCGSGLIQPTGRILQDGQPITINKGESLRVGFHQLKDGSPWDSFWANTQPDGVFEVEGRLRKGVPPGEYRISIEVTSGRSDHDRLNGAFSIDKSPIIRNLTADNDEEIVIDLAKPEG